jgi:hypothetical protein
VQKPHPPIWVGASGETTIRLVARYADVWNAAGGDPDGTRKLVGMLEQACAAIGRDPSEIRRSVQFDWDGRDRAKLLEQCGVYLEQGITEQVIYVRGVEPLAHAHKLAEALPELRKLDRGAAQLR